MSLAGCPGAGVPNLKEATVSVNDLPTEPDKVIKYADDEESKQTATSAENEVAAIDKGLLTSPNAYELLWRGARACAWLTEEFTDKERRGPWAQKGIDFAKRAVAANDKRVEGYYYLGINLGQSATTKTVGAYLMVPKVIKAGEAALKIDEKFDHAGPGRLLGNVYAKAPPWPASVGDVDDGIKYLKRAVEVAPDYPQNHLHYGDALLSDKQYDEAQKQYQLVLDSRIPLEWAHKAEAWRVEAQAGMKKIAEKR
ncbi:MAG: tetratricopeptide repeat protein [Polyangia bacterium]